MPMSTDLGIEVATVSQSGADVCGGLPGPRRVSVAASLVRWWTTVAPGRRTHTAVSARADTKSGAVASRLLEAA